MGTVGDRIREIRRIYGLTQAEFAEKVGFTRSATQKIEYGLNTPAKSTIQLICRVFAVNEAWLVSGEGEMQAPQGPDSAMVAKLIGKYDNSPVVRSIIDAYLSLSLEDQARVEKFVANLSVAIARNVAPEDTVEDLVSDIDSEDA